MIALYIFLGILGFLLLLLGVIGACKLSLRAAYCQSALLVVGIGPFKLTLVGGEKQEEAEEAPKKQKEGKKKPKKEKKKKKKPKKPSKATEKPRLAEIITAFRDLLFGLLRDFKRQLKIEELRLRVLVASEDAAMTALEYGAVCALAEPIHQVAAQAKCVRKDRLNVSVECDFLADKPEIDAEFCLSVRIWKLGWVALRSTKPLLHALSLLRIYRSAAEGENNEEENSSDTDP